MAEVLLLFDNSIVNTHQKPLVVFDARKRTMFIQRILKNAKRPMNALNVNFAFYLFALQELKSAQKTLKHKTSGLGKLIETLKIHTKFFSHPDYTVGSGI